MIISKFFGYWRIEAGWHKCRQQSSWTIYDTNSGSLLIGHLGTNFSETRIKIQQFSHKKAGLRYVVCKMWAILSWSQCLKEPKNVFANLTTLLNMADKMLRKVPVPRVSNVSLRTLINWMIDDNFPSRISKKACVNAMLCHVVNQSPVSISDEISYCSNEISQSLEPTGTLQLMVGGSTTVRLPNFRAIGRS